jgi:antitoxin ParD1/3/4
MTTSPGDPTLAWFTEKDLLCERRNDAVTTMNISLPEEMKAFVEDRATQEGFGTVSEYVTAIIREAQERHAAREQLDILLLEGLNSGAGTPLTESDLEHIRHEGKKLIAQRKGK